MPCAALVQGLPSLMRQNDPGTVAALARLRTMKSKSRNIKRDQQDDGWTWVVIGLIFGAATLVLYGPFIWQMTHGSL
jgi:hypothetical protein